MRFLTALGLAVVLIGAIVAAGGGIVIGLERIGQVWLAPYALLALGVAAALLVRRYRL